MYLNWLTWLKEEKNHFKDSRFFQFLCLQRFEEVKGSAQIRKILGAFEVNCLFWAQMKKINKNKNKNIAVAKLQIPGGRVEWPAKSNFSVCVFTRVAIAEGKCIVSALGSFSLLWKFSDPLFSSVVCNVHGMAKIRIIELLDGMQRNYIFHSSVKHSAWLKV